MDILMTMPIADRRFYIMMHNNQDNSKAPEIESTGLEGENDKLQMLSDVKDWH